MYGGAGGDTYYVDATGDRVIEDAGDGGYDRIYSAVSFTLGEGVEVLELVGRSGLDGVGNALGNGLTGNSSVNRLVGLAGDDNLYGGGGADTLEGGEGADQLDGGAGGDAMYGGAGSDVYYLDSASDAAVETLFQSQGGGFDTVYLHFDANYTLGASVEDLHLNDSNAALSATGNLLGNAIYGSWGDNRLSGSDGNDRLYGSLGADVLYGGSGADALYGGSWADTLYGDAGADIMEGYIGNDLYFVDSAADRVVEVAFGYDEYYYDWYDGGIDTVSATSSFTLGDYVEHLTLTGTAAANGVGNGLDNTLTGNTVVNMLRGMAGADTIRSFSGADTVVGGTGRDVFQYQAVTGSNPGQRDVFKAGDGAVAFEGAGSAAGDLIDLALIDADATRSGIQDFVFGTASGKGRLWASPSGTLTLISGNADADAAAEFQVAIDDGALKHTAYGAADFLV